MNVFVFIIFCVIMCGCVAVMAHLVNKLEHNQAYLKGYETAKTVWRATRELPKFENIPYPDTIPNNLKYDFARGYRQAIQHIKNQFFII